MAPRNQAEDKVVRSLSVDGLVALIAVLFLAVVHMSIPVLCFIWVVLTAAVIHFIYNIPFFESRKGVKALVVVIVGCGMMFLAYDAVVDRINTDAVREEAERARVDILDVRFADVGKSDAAFPFFAFFYKNTRHLTAQGVRRRFALQSVDYRLLSEAEIDAMFKTLESDHYVFNASDQIPPDGDGHFSEPNARGEEQRAMDSALPDVRTGKSVLYLLEVTWYRDQLLPANEVRVSEFCGFFDKQLVLLHFCRQNNVHIQKIK
jgi:hypothetical protein